MTVKDPDEFKNPETFKAARKNLGLSQVELCDVLDLKGRAIDVSRYECGRRKISGPIARLMWLLEKYGVPEIFRS